MTENNIEFTVTIDDMLHGCMAAWLRSIDGHILSEQDNEKQLK
jgi:hypothetical protein